MRHVLFALLAIAWPVVQEAVRPRPADIAFRVQMIDPGFSESVAVADFINKGGRNDILTSMAHSYGVLWLEQHQCRTSTETVTWTSSRRGRQGCSCLRI